MRRPLFLYENLVDVGSVYPTSENSSLPGTNVQHSFRTKVWEVTSPVSDLVIDFGTAQTLTTVALIDYDWTSAPNSLYLEFSASSFAPASGQTQELTWCPNPTSYGNPASIIQTFTLNTTYRYARLRVNHGATWDLGRLFIGDYFEPAFHMAQGAYNYRIEDDSKVLTSVGGQEHVDAVTKYRTAQAGFHIRTQAELDSFYKVYNEVGKQKDIFFALDYTNKSNDDTLYGKLISDISVKKRGPWHWYLALKFREAR